MTSEHCDFKKSINHTGFVCLTVDADLVGRAKFAVKQATCWHRKRHGVSTLNANYHTYIL